MAKTIKFFEDALKTNQVYPDIDPQGIYPGVTVGLAENLAEDYGEQKDAHFQYRSTASHSSVKTDGYASLYNLYGATSVTTAIPEYTHFNLLTTGIKKISVNFTTFKGKSDIDAAAIPGTIVTYDFIYTPTVTYNSNLISSINKATFAKKMNGSTGSYIFEYDAAIDYNDASTLVQSFNKNTFSQKVLGVPNAYTFTYNSNNWYLDSEIVTLSQYGFSLNSTTLTDGMSIVVYYTSNNWKYGTDIVALAQYGIITTGRETPGDTITITYSANNWAWEGDIVTISSYGISIDNGSPAINDDIQILYRKAADQGSVVTIANPTHLLSIGMNQFNKKGSQILSNSEINNNGAIGSANDHYVIWFKCLGGETYTIYDKNANSIIKAAYYDKPVTSYSTGLTLLNEVTITSSGNTVSSTATKKYYQTDYNGYMVIETTDIADLCCHLTWTGTADEEYVDYWEFKLEIPYKDKNGNTISTYGLPHINNVYDEIDFLNKKYYKRIDRTKKTPENLATISAQTSNYIYDVEWIYYELGGVNVYDLPDRDYIYPAADYGTEEFLGSELELYTTIYYQTNLKDKLRNDVEVIANKSNTLDIEENINIKYPTVNAVKTETNKIYTMLGLAIDTYETGTSYAIGDYVVKDNELYKCTTAGAGHLESLTPTTASYSTPNTIINSFNSSTFISDTFVQAGGLGEYVFELLSQTDNETTEYSAKLTAPNGASEASDWSSTSTNAFKGITPSGTVGKTIIIVSNGYWTKSYLFKA